ncbi:MAG: DUF354 domain-containing protein [Promethearchaeota archaeon]
MNLLIDLCHPTEFFFSYRIIKELQARGHRIIITARKEKVLRDLLKNSEFEYYFTSKKANSLIKLLLELLTRTWRIFKIAFSSKVDLFFGMSILSSSVAGFLLRKPTLLFTEQESMGIKTKLVFKLASKVYTPIFFDKALGRKHKKLNGLLQLTYLHPRYFSPKKTIVEDLLSINLEEERYFIVRFCDWKASHDINQKGFSIKTKMQIINDLSKAGRVYVLDEENGELFQSYRLDIPKHLIHHVLAFSSFSVVETTSVAIESALLGVPVVRCTTLASTKKGGAAIFRELEKIGLVFSYSDEKNAYQKIGEFLSNQQNKDYWLAKRDGFIRDFDKNLVLTLTDEIEQSLKK